MQKALVVSKETIQEKIYLIRGRKVMIDRDLALLYGVETRALLQAVKRNRERFPGDFMFQLTSEEAARLRSQIVILKKRGQHSKYYPHAFTEQGIAMLSSVLRSKCAIQVNIAIMRTFVKLKEILSTRRELVHQLTELERKVEKHDSEIQAIFEAIRILIAEPRRPKRRIGFHL